MDLKPGYKQTEVGAIPEDWEVRSIGSVCKLINGRGFKPFEWENTGIPIIRIQNLNGSDEFNFYTGKYDRKLEVQPGQLLFAWSGSRGTSFGPHVWKGPFGLLNYHTWKIQIYDSEICRDFLVHELRQLTTFIEGWAHGASALVHVQKWQMEGFQFAVPPTKAEQEAIAEVLSDADAQIASLEQLIVKKRHLKQGAMQELLTGKRRLPGFVVKTYYKQTEVGVIPEDWNIIPLSELGKFKNGINKNSEAFGHGFPFVNLMDVFGVSRITSNHSLGLVETNNVEQQTYNLQKGDVIFIRSSVKPSGVGLTAVVERNLDKTVYSGFLIRFRDGGNLSRGFKRHCFYEDGFRKRVIGASSVSANTNINQDSLKRLLLAFPPTKAEQTAIATILSDMDAEIAAFEAKLTKARQLKQGMTQELLTGRRRLL